MITALDSSILWAIVNQEPAFEGWLQSLMQAASDRPLIISPVAFAELAPSAPDATALNHFLAKFGISYSPINETSSHLAGHTFKRYRNAGGPRQQLIPDFMIAAHAQIQANRLAAIDRGCLRIWFPELQLLPSA